MPVPQEIDSAATLLVYSLGVGPSVQLLRVIESQTRVLVLLNQLYFAVEDV